MAEKLFAKAIAQYEALLTQYQSLELLDRVKQAVSQLEAEAAAAASQHEAQARRLLEEKKYAEARQALQPAVDRFGITEHSESAKKLLAEIDKAEQAGAKAAMPAAPSPAPPQPAKVPEQLAIEAELKTRREREARYKDATRSVEELAAAWDFRGAATELAKVHVEEPELQKRLAQRRDELKRMHDLKQKLIRKINEADPPVKKAALGIKGMSGEVTGASKTEITAKLFNGQTETTPWSRLGPAALLKLFAPKTFETLMAPATADDWLAAGLIALTHNSGQLAERCLDEAAQLGAEIEKYQNPLAESALARADDDLRQAEGLMVAGRQALAANKLPEAAKAFAQAEKLYRQAESALAELESKYSQTEWYRTGKVAVDAARQTARRGGLETEAERLYLDAARAFTQNELFDVKPLVDKLKAEYGGTPAVTDIGRKPSFAEFEKATANLGKRLTVRKDGKGDFTSIQAAIDAAPAHSLIEIEDNGMYYEKVVIAKDGITLRGGKGRWPVVTSVGMEPRFPRLVNSNNDTCVLENLILIHSPAGTGAAVVSAASRVQCCIMAITDGEGVMASSGEINTCVLVPGSLYCDMISRKIRNSVLFGRVRLPPETFVHNCVFVGGIYGGFFPKVTFYNATVSERLSVGESTKLFDSIIHSVETNAQNVAIEYCDVYGKPGFIDGARPGKGCFSVLPMFRDPANLDYRLMPGSPCIGKASDGGDIGCRYTPEMIELCKVALELRRRGMIKF